MWKAAKRFGDVVGRVGLDSGDLINPTVNQPGRGLAAALGHCKSGAGMLLSDSTFVSSSFLTLFLFFPLEQSPTSGPQGLGLLLQHKFSKVFSWAPRPFACCKTVLPPADPVRTNRHSDINKPDHNRKVLPPISRSAPKSFSHQQAKSSYP